MGMKNVWLITRPVSDTSIIKVLKEVLARLQSVEREIVT